MPDREDRRPYAFRVVDVFTNKLFSGNQLAVFLDGTGLTDQEMLAITREMNYSETTFIFPPSRPDAHARVRIFTSGGEVPFAGHPTIGTAFVLATDQSSVIDTQQIVLEEGVGPVSVRLSGEPGRPQSLWISLPPVTFHAPFEKRGAIAQALGLRTTDLLEGAPIQVASAGNPFIYVPVKNRSLVDKVVIDIEKLQQCFQGIAPLKMYIFALDERLEEGQNIFARMLKLYQSSIVEDAATGSAAGPLGAYLVEHRLISFQHETTLVIEQGTKMGRPSLLHLHLQKQPGAPLSVEVGGSAVPVYEGTLYLPR